MVPNRAAWEELGAELPIEVLSDGQRELLIAICRHQTCRFSSIVEGRAKSVPVPLSRGLEPFQVSHVKGPLFSTIGFHSHY